MTVQQLHLATVAERLQGCGEAGSACMGNGPATTGWQRDNKKRCRESEAGQFEPRNKACIFSRGGHFLPEKLPEDCDGFFNKGFLNQERMFS